MTHGPMNRMTLHILTWMTCVFMHGIFPMDTAAFEVTVQNASGVVGGEATVSVMIDDASNMLSADITLDFDPSVVAPTGVELADLTSDFIVAHTVTWGAVSIAVAGSAAIADGSGVLVKVAFRIDGEAETGETAITVSKAVVYGSDHQANDSLTPGAFGTMEIRGIEAGDVNGDGYVNLADAVSALQAWAGAESTFDMPSGADIKGDGKIAFEEIICVLQKVAGRRE
jgi:hypothetical protein